MTTTDFSAARQAMIDSQLRPQGVSNPAILAAMASVPREDFVPADSRSVAYADRSVPLGDGRSLSPPAALGQLLMALAPVAGENALVVGSGGYAAAVLAAVGCDVVALDTAAAKASGLKAVAGQLADGHAAGAPYDLILIDGAVEHIPAGLVAQLADGGRLGCGLVQDRAIRLILGTKSGDAFGQRTIGDSALPRLPGFARPPVFTF